MELDPRNAQAHMNLADALQWQGNLAEAKTHFQQAQQIDPGIDQAGSDSGIAFFNREQFISAVKASDCGGVIAYGKKILALAPDDEEIVKAVAACAPNTVH